MPLIVPLTGMSVHYYFLYNSLRRVVRFAEEIRWHVFDLWSTYESLPLFRWLYRISSVECIWFLSCWPIGAVTVAVLFRIVIIHRKISQLHWHASPFTYSCSAFVITVVCPFTSAINTRLRLLRVFELLLTCLYSVSIGNVFVYGNPRRWRLWSRECTRPS